MINENSTETKRGYGFWAFTPLLVFLIIFLGSGLMYTALGTEAPFKQVPVLGALMIGVTVAFFMNRKVSFDAKITAFSKGISDGGVIMMVLIFSFAGVFSTVAKTMGGVESVVNLGLSIIPANFLAPGIFIIGCLISLSTGTCFGTVVAMGPIAVGIVEATGMNTGIALAAVFGGAMFGDNLSVISDTTIAATRGVGAEMKDKFRMNFKIAIVAAIAAAIVFAIVGGAAQDTVGPYDYSLIKILPYVAVLVAAIAGMDVLLVLISGTILAAVIGFLTSSLTIPTLMQGIGNGVKDMSEAIFVALFVRGITGLIEMNGGITWLVDKISSRIRTRRGAEYAIASLTSLLSFSLLDNTVAILTVSPIAKNIGDQHAIAPKRMASILDIFACVALCVAPHSSMITMLSTMGGISPFEILSHVYYQMFLGIAAIITIQFGIMRTKAEKAADKAASEASASV